MNKETKTPLISTNTFVANVERTEAVDFAAIVSQRTHGEIIFSRFAVKTFIDAMRIDAMNTSSKKVEGVQCVLILAAQLVANPERREVRLDVNRLNVTTLKELVEIKLNHCEQEKANDNPDFCADTYVSMKLLLLDIREWLSVTVISTNND